MVIFPDEGNRYTNSIYNDDYLQAMDGWTGELPESPTKVTDPAEPLTGWSQFQWNRRPLAAVMEKDWMARV